MEQTERDIALTLQRDYRTFDLAKTTQLSNRVTMYTGWSYTSGASLDTVTWFPGSEVSAAFTVLHQLLTQLSVGSYQNVPAVSPANPSIWPVSSINWQWIQSLYAYVNPVYDTWLEDNNIVVPDWSTNPG